MDKSLLEIKILFIFQFIITFYLSNLNRYTKKACFLTLDKNLPA